MALTSNRPDYSPSEIAYSRGRSIYKRQQELGWSSASCATAIGVSPSRWQSIIAGKTPLTLTSATRICSALSMSITDLAYPAVVTPAGDVQ